MLWYQKLVTDLKQEGFKINRYDPCVANKRVNGSNLTLVWHVDDLMISHKDENIVNEFIEWLDKTYSDETGQVKTSGGPRHEYLGMVLDFSAVGKVKIDMTDYVKKMLTEFPDNELQQTRLGNQCPWTEQLFAVDEESPKLQANKKQLFHTTVAKGLFVAKRGRPDILPAIAFLCTRVQEPTQQDWNKLLKMLKFLARTKDDVLTLSAEEVGLHLHWYYYASFAVHRDFKSHTGGMLTLGRGALACVISKQKLNSRSLTEAEVIAADDGMSAILWTKNFLEAQGFVIDDNILYQDNKSAILLEKNGKGSSSKRTRHINIRYFFITDNVEKNNLRIEYCPTDDMLGDYFTKPTTGEKFRSLRAAVMNLPLEPVVWLDSEEKKEE